ncbi:MAG: DUF2157 domain-containing protein [Actinomycetota bacterium]
MSNSWQSYLARWLSADLVNAETAETIRAWEQEHGEERGRNRFAVIAFGFGGLLLMAGVLLFVASNWRELSPVARLILLTAAVGLFHVGGAFVSRSKPALGTTLHAVGTGALGGGIFASGQTFNLAVNWPEGFLLWAIGAAAGLYLLRDWPHVLFTATLVPLWLWSEFAKVAGFDEAFWIVRPAASFTVLLAIAYISAVSATERSTWRKALSGLGAAAFIPSAIVLGTLGAWDRAPANIESNSAVVIGAWVLAFSIPAGLAYLLRGKDAVWMTAALAWVLAIGQFNPRQDAQFLGLLALYAAGSVGIVLWGLRDRYRLLVNVGVVSFALSVLVFYFASTLFSKLGRSVGLIGAGLLFIGGGWFLERTRRTILGKMDTETL